MKKYAVFALMGIICAGCMWFIFAPSADEKVKREQQSGFNADIPMPKDEGIIGDKASAYEQEQIQQKQAERMRSLADFSSLLDAGNTKQPDDLALPADEPQTAKSGSRATHKPIPVQNSVNAYRDINRQLGSFYETPKSDPEKEALKKQMEELQARMEETENRKKSADEQMALMEKSFQMVAKYMPGTVGGIEAQGANEQAAANAGTNTSGKTVVVPVSQVTPQTVSALAQEMSGKDVMQALAQPRNMGFFTATAEGSKERKNTISACIHADQTITDGESVRLSYSKN